MVVNGREYKTPELTLGVACDIEKLGCSINDASEQPLNFAICFCAVMMGVSKDDAAEAIQAHMRSGYEVGDILNEIVGVVDRANASGFKKLFV